MGGKGFGLHYGILTIIKSLKKLESEQLVSAETLEIPVFFVLKIGKPTIQNQSEDRVGNFF